MPEPIDKYWEFRLKDTKEQLQANNFDVSIAADLAEAKHIVLEKLIPEIAPQSIAWGGSMTVVTAGLYDALQNNADIEVIDTLDKSVPTEELVARRRNALLVDLFITGSNALTEDGQLVNLDMIGNRVGAMMWGPRHVLLIIGRNKLCADLEDAMFRIKNYAAPVNTMNLDKQTPCAATGVCQDCASPDRICNYWTIIEKSFVKHRIKIILVNEDLGF